MTTTTEATASDLSWAKASASIALTYNQRHLVALQLANRAHLAGMDAPTNGDEWRILRSIASTSREQLPLTTDAFSALLVAYDDWTAVQNNVEEWRHRSDVVDTDPMSADVASGYVQERLDDALTALLGPAPVAAR
jgi:hypothetical protein